ncbi:metal ABC transporter permease [Nesterenkonia xinjiangensis]|uniref:Manganese transport system permease protein n=1 Tax=Nesterenkonia xinjiangensis TaxID=225327 RepID=A0A7Z0GQ22_9MICC|nr:metal ABC transporter permease [Nesterenkonia xinjiangensis]NYJ79201.1 manganese transport system permease protein [Nesterenkonia xinjiangensis]
MSTLSELLLGPLEFGFMQNALLVSVVAAGVCGLLSSWLVLMGWSLMGEAVAHSILPGIVLAYIFGVPMAVGAFVFGMLAVALIGGISTSSTLKHDTVIGVVFTSLFALGLVLISRTPSQTHLQHILFGNVLGTSRTDLYQVLVLGALTAAVLLIKRRDFTLLAFDRTFAHTIGLSTAGLSAVLLMLLALTTVTALQTLGIILVVAMLVIPGATALLVTRTFGPMLAVASSSAVASAVVGVYASYWLDIATGGTIVLVQAAQFTAAYLFAPRKGLLGQAVRRHRPAAPRIDQASASTERTS